MIIINSKIIVTDLQYKSISGKLFAFKDGKAFSDKAWSEDKKTYMLEFERGAISTFRYFHDNEETYYCITYNDLLIGGKSTDFGNEYGLHLTEEQAKGLYPDLYMNLKSDMIRIKEIIKSHPYNK